MYSAALFARLEAKSGKEAAVAQFLQQGLAMANAEATTPLWFAQHSGPSTFYVFDVFMDESGRQAHLNGPTARALMGVAAELLAKPTHDRINRHSWCETFCTKLVVGLLCAPIMHNRRASP
jgi:quinol monooxygenase YgiN